MIKRDIEKLYLKETKDIITTFIIASLFQLISIWPLFKGTNWGVILCLGIISMQLAKITYFLRRKNA